MTTAPVILIVDDGPENIRQLRTLLRDEGKVVFARDGAEALRQAADHLPALILLDIVMPGMDGYEVCRRLKADAALAAIPVIFVTSADGERDEARGLELGAIDYITKPFSPAIIRARVRNQLALSAAAEKLRRMEAASRQWMADTSHELRTPITVLCAQIEAMQDGVYPVDAKRLAVLHREVLGMSRLIDDLYLLARSDVAQLECRADPVAVLPLLDDVVTAFRDSFAAAGLELAWRWDGAETGPVVACDAPQLARVFSNLLQNTLRYTDAGGALRIEWALEADCLRLDFDDTAPGVPDPALARLFDRFYRVDPSRSRVGGGSGLGLALCKSLVEAQQGRVDAAHSPLGGLRVTIELPRLVPREPK